MRERGGKKGVEMTNLVYGSVLSLAAAAMLVVPSSALAQAEAPKVVQVTVVQVEGADQDAFMERVKKAQAIWYELKMPSFRAWQSTLAGPNTGSVVFVTQLRTRVLRRYPHGEGFDCCTKDSSEIAGGRK